MDRDCVPRAGRGVWLTELAPVAEPELVPRTVAAVLGVREEPGRFMLDTLVEAIGDRRLLLLLDNAEHVLGAVAKVADAIMRSCPLSCLLVTSRQPLGIGGERVMRIGPLAVPPAELDQRFQLLTTGSRTALARHQTLRALIDWSYELLSPDERMVAERFSVFAGGWTLDAAEAVAAGGGIEEWQVLDLLAALVDKSLVQADESRGSLRYRFLETVRAYAAERLALRGSAAQHEVRSAHRDHYLALVETAAAELRGPDELRWLDRIEAEFDNIRAALAFSIADPDTAEPGLRLAARLRWFCYMRGHSAEVIEALSALLARADARQPTRHVARALTVSCHLLNHFGRDPAIPSMAAEAITIARGLSDDALAGDALAALARADEAVALARAAGESHLITATLGHRAVFKSEAGDLEASLADQQEILSLSRGSGDNYVLALTLANLGIDQLAAGETEAALAHLQEALGIADAHGYQHLSAGVRENLGFASLMGGAVASARRLLADVLDTALATGERTYVHGALLGLALAVGADGDARACPGEIGPSGPQLACP